MAEKAKRLTFTTARRRNGGRQNSHEKVLEVRVYSYSKLVGVGAPALNSCEHYDFVLGF